MKENGRIVKNNCEKRQFDLFIKRLKQSNKLTLTKYKPASDTVLQERYTFSCGNERASLVLETNSGTLVITATEHLLRLLDDNYELAARDAAFGQQPPPQTKIVVSSRPVKAEQKKSAVTAAITKPPQTKEKEKITKTDKIISLEKATPLNPRADVKQKSEKSAVDKEKSALKIKAENLEGTKLTLSSSSMLRIEAKTEVPLLAQGVAKEVQGSPKKLEKNETAPKQTQPKKTVKPQKTEEKQAEQKIFDEQKSLDELYKNGFSIKKYPLEKLESFFKKLKTLKSVMCRLISNGDGGRSYLISDGKNKVYLRYIDAKHTLQLQGKRSKLFGEVQVLISSDSDYVTAVSSHIDLTGEEKRAKDMEKRLKKLLPEAFDFLSEQSRIDITIGMMDIGSEDVKLSDYSMLLVPPYRGLERLIFDLQRAKNIEVKMIGQAYEKDASGYVLKAGYRRKIGSIVYAEVMSALYTEYFARRNFYAHSDITGDLLSRVITEKSAVKEIFANFVAVIEYNIKKLKEIGFKI